MILDTLTVILGWVIFVIVISATLVLDWGKVSTRFATIAGLGFLFFAYWLPWVNLNPHHYFLDSIVPAIDNVLALAMVRLLEWLGRSAIAGAFETVLQIIGPPAPLLALSIPKWGALGVRLLLLVALPLLFLYSLVRMLIELLSDTFWDWFPLVQTLAATLVVLLLLWKLPEIDGWGYPDGIQSGMLVLALAPELGPGPWVTLQGLLLLIFGGVYELIRKEEPTQTVQQRPPRYSSYHRSGKQ
jgi:hypothetical protein